MYLKQHQGTFRHQVNVWFPHVFSDDTRAAVSSINIQTDSASLGFTVSVVVQSEGGPEAINGKIGVVVLLGEPCLSENHDTTVLKVLLEANVPLELVVFILLKWA